jgi:hypothetical protein
MSSKGQISSMSREALASLSAKKLGERQRQIVDVLRELQRLGQPNATLTEIAEAYNRMYSPKVPMHSGKVSGRISELIAAGRVARVGEAQARACSVTGSTCQPVYLVAQQEALV